MPARLTKKEKMQTILDYEKLDEMAIRRVGAKILDWVRSNGGAPRTALCLEAMPRDDPLLLHIHDAVAVEMARRDPLRPAADTSGGVYFCGPA